MESLPTKEARTAYGTLYGMLPDPTPLSRISPAADLVLSFPPDPPHSECNGISRMMHEILVDAILTTKGKFEYSDRLRKFAFPPGWSRLQSPIHHLKQYSLSDHARWSIIVPLLLRSWLEEKHIHGYFREAALIENEDVVSYVVSCYALVAKSNTVTQGLEVSINDRENIKDVVKNGRLAFQSLCATASRSVAENPRAGIRPGTPGGRGSRSRTPVVQAVEEVSRYDQRLGPHSGQAGSRPGTRAGSRTSSPVPIASPSTYAIRQSNPPAIVTTKVKKFTKAEEEARDKKGRKEQYNKDAKKPNVHIGLHFGMVEQEYGLPANLNVLIGEDKHRSVFPFYPNTKPISLYLSGVSSYGSLTCVSSSRPALCHKLC